MNMNIIDQKVGRAALGLAAIVAGCAPMSVELEHRGGAGDTGDAGSGANISGTGGRSSGATSGGSNPGGAGRGGTGAAGAPTGTGGVGVGAGGVPAGSGGAGAVTGVGTIGEDQPPVCADGGLTDVRNGHDLLPGYGAPPETDAQVSTWLSAMSLNDKTAQMEGVPEATRDYQDIERGTDVTVAGVGALRGYRFRNGSRGVNLDAGQDNRDSDGNDFSTAFPAPSIRAAAWDHELEWQVGEAIGDETAASKNNLLQAPGAALLRHPYWGRGQDSYGEDVYGVARQATAFVAGVQQHVAACVTHYVTSAAEKARSSLNGVIDEQTLRE
ncbi:MAG TPA: glycoside hydrolase family 3 N-terminal domain-containing protein, partial [Polyangiaceae bacterium]|nr:glycoside hydrolase family 3 N-terminal domain-containing protein [Polyangiaceae bacterium]